MKHSNLNKIKRQRNILQVKKNDKNPQKQANKQITTTKKEEIGRRHKKEFRIMIGKMIQNFENKMELQINRLETRIEMMQEMFIKDLEEI